METENTRGENNKDKHADHWHHAHGHRAVKLIILLLLLVLAFVCGVSVGRHGQSWMRGRMMVSTAPAGSQSNTMYFSQGGQKPAMTMPAPGNMINMGKAMGGQRVAGTISSIAGTKITITDNGAAKQDIYSDANTVILASSGEVSLSSLKTGQFITSFVVAKAGKNTAQTIQIQ